MALHDYTCTAHDRPQIVQDHYVPATLRASEHPPSCPLCGAAMQWIPQVGAMDAREPFNQFTAMVQQRDGSQKEVTIGSLHQLRKIEHETEIAARNGEGQQMVWRDYSQERGTGRHLEHSFAPDPSTKPDTSNPRVKVTAVAAEVAEAQEYGPGVDDSSTSILADG